MAATVSTGSAPTAIPSGTIMGSVTAGTPQQLPVTKERTATIINAIAGSKAGLIYGATVSTIKSDIPIAARTFCSVSAEMIIANIRNISANPEIKASENSLNVILRLIRYIAEATTVPIITP